MRALVIGGTGFLGRHIVRMLRRRGDFVRVFARQVRPDSSSNHDMDVASGDIRDPEAVECACRDVDTVFHAAGRPGIWGAKADYFEINVRGTDNVIHACLRNGVSRLLYTSSPSVVHHGRDIEGGDESLPYARRFTAYYPASKARAEQHVLAANGKPTPNGPLATCALRPHLLWGPGDPHFIPRILHLARTGRLRQIGDGKNKVDLTYVDNAAHAHLLAADRLQPGSPVAGSAYFITDGAPVRLWAWIGDLLEAAGLPPISRAIPAWLARSAAAVCELVYHSARLRSEPPLTRFLVDQLSTSHWFDISRARADLGYTPIVSPEAGFEKLVEWIRGMPDNNSPDSSLRG